MIVAGDAARHTNPLTGGGISAALIGGHHAGKVAAGAVKNGDVTSNGLKEYMSRIDKDIVKANLRAYRLKEGVYKLSDKAFNRTAHQIMALPAHKHTLRNVFLRGLVSQPKLMVDVIKAFV